MCSCIAKISNLDKYFADNKVLDAVDFNIDKGQKVVLCGPSGSGKSTLIRILMGLEVHDSGTLLVHGHNIRPGQGMPWSVSSKTGMLFQHFYLFPHLTILENCSLAPILVKKMDKAAANAQSMRLLERVNIQEQADKYPIALSGGQQQRAAIARCLCMQPELLLFDEPTSALDPEMIQEVLDVMLELAESGITMVCVTHEMAFAKKFADNMVFMDQGQVCLATSTEQFFADTEHTRVRAFLDKIIGH